MGPLWETRLLLSGAADVGGVAAANINKEHTIASMYPTGTTFTVDTGDAASSTTTGGGSSVVATYQAGTYYPPVGALPGIDVRCWHDT
jgi:hypothetical protein